MGCRTSSVRLFQQVEQIPLGLTYPAPDGRQLHGAGLPAQVPLRLETADDPPAQGGQYQPPVKRHPIDGSRAGLLVGNKKVFDAAQAAGPLTGRSTEPPRSDAEPGQVFI